MEVGLSSPSFQRAGSTREQGLHAKDSKMQNKAEQREEKVARKGTSTKPKWTQEAKKMRSLYKITQLLTHTKKYHFTLFPLSTYTVYYIFEWGRETNLVCEWMWFCELQIFFCEWRLLAALGAAKHESVRSSHDGSEWNRFHTFHRWALGNQQRPNLLYSKQKDDWRQTKRHFHWPTSAVFSLSIAKYPHPQNQPHVCDY